MGSKFNQPLSYLLSAVCIILSVSAYVPVAYADTNEGEAEAARWIAENRKPTALALHRSTTRKRKNVEDPDQYAPDSKIDQTVQQLTQQITMAMAPLQSILGTMGGLSSAMKGAIGKIGGFSSGLSALSSLTGENENSNGPIVACPVPASDPTTGQPITGKLLASPVVGMRAIPIVGGANACQQGSEVPCDEDDYKDNTKDVPSNSKKSPFTNPAPNGRGLEQ